MGKTVMEKVQLAPKAQDKWRDNLIRFLVPVGILYLTTIVGVISQDNHAFSFKDLIPNTFAQGGIVLYVLNSGLDYLRKLQA